MFTDYDLKAMRADWARNNVDFDTSRTLFKYGYITECEFEFGPHDNHDDCAWTIANMTAYDMGDDGGYFYVPEDMYYAGTGELYGDPSYERYLNGG